MRINPLPYSPSHASYPLGALLTVYHIRNELPFPRSAVCVRMLGRDIRSALEVMVAGYPRPQGCFPHLSGNARMVYDDEKVWVHAWLSWVSDSSCG